MMLQTKTGSNFSSEVSKQIYLLYNGLKDE